MICVAFSSQILSNLPVLPHLELLDYSCYLVTVLVTAYWQTRGRGFEPGVTHYIFSGKYPGA